MILIDIFREYLESQVKIPAMESTSRELIVRINMLKDGDNYNFEKKQTGNSKFTLTVLQTIIAINFWTWMSLENCMAFSTSQTF